LLADVEEQSHTHYIHRALQDSRNTRGTTIT
jgi:hypothetical protein